MFTMQPFRYLLAATTALLMSGTLTAQELFVFTEPASNMAAHSVGLRLNNYFASEATTSTKIEYHLVPEIMLGLSKHMMLHGDLFFSNRTGELRGEGGSIYAKYRVLSMDAVQRHFRMAAFGRVSFNSSELNQEEINLNGYNTGFELGLVSTQLLHKVALSSALSFANAADNGYRHPFPYGRSNRNVMNFTFSAGRLMLPRQYTDYRQTNVNLMIELLGQYNPGPGKYYIDAAPAVQFIFNSQGRIDIGLRKQVKTSMTRSALESWLVRFECNLFNAY